MILHKIFSFFGSAFNHLNTLINYPKSGIQSVNRSSGTDAPLSAPFLLLLVVMYAAWQGATQGSWVFSGEMWAEMATNYYANANSDSWYLRFFATDFGYIPFADRLIALLGVTLHLPASAIPYFYTWSAIIITPLLVGVFCLPRFRVIVRSDFLRFLICVAVLFVADFETKTFINFTYFSAFGISVISVLAYLDEKMKPPIWIWLYLPIFILSKPAALATIPFLLIATFVSRGGFRWLGIVTIAIACLQVWQLILSQDTGLYVAPFEATWDTKMNAVIRYFVGFTSMYLTGPNLFNGVYTTMNFLIVGGFCILASIFYFILFERKEAAVLILSGFSLAFFAILLNCFSSPQAWISGFDRLTGVPLLRNTLLVYMGVVLVVAGVAVWLGSQSKGFSLKFYLALLSVFSVFIPFFVFIYFDFLTLQFQSVLIYLTGLILALIIYLISKQYFFKGEAISVVFFTAWFYLAGWLDHSFAVAKPPIFPNLGNSQWQQMARVLDSNEPYVCIPINPLGWFYGRNCKFLNPEVNLGVGIYYNFLPIDGSLDKSVIKFNVEDKITYRILSAVGLFINVNRYENTVVSAIATVKGIDGQIMVLRGSTTVNKDGALLLLSSDHATWLGRPVEIQVEFNQVVNVARDFLQKEKPPLAMWMGF